MRKHVTVLSLSSLCNSIFLLFLLSASHEQQYKKKRNKGNLLKGSFSRSTLGAL